ncbi:hypothetical protein J2853_002310 [Streptosporangium lutulentum]|uniref:Uncharacterized protein n=1 Tax=Streptosporangium lutulentum TaxID=1461250 RepID=A0ABT9QAY3_9ACTN|nr:hypothetical protein [Streptosporangium lutulentum]
MPEWEITGVHPGDAAAGITAAASAGTNMLTDVHRRAPTCFEQASPVFGPADPSPRTKRISRRTWRTDSGGSSRNAAGGTDRPGEHPGF